MVNGCLPQSHLIYPCKICDKNINDKDHANNLLPPIFNNWFTLVSAQHSYQTSSSTKEKLFKPPFKTISYGKNSVIASSI